MVRVLPLSTQNSAQPAVRCALRVLSAHSGTKAVALTAAAKLTTRSTR